MDLNTLITSVISDHEVQAALIGGLATLFSGMATLIATLSGSFALAVLPIHQYREQEQQKQMQENRKPMMDVLLSLRIAHAKNTNCAFDSFDPEKCYGDLIRFDQALIDFNKLLLVSKGIYTENKKALLVKLQEDCKWEKGRLERLHTQSQLLKQVHTPQERKPILEEMENLRKQEKHFEVQLEGVIDQL